MPSPHVLRKTTSIITAFDYLLTTAFNYEVKFDLYSSDRVYNWTSNLVSLCYPQRLFVKSFC